MADIGRPPVTDDQYKTWLDMMTPFLKSGNTLWYAMDKSQLISNKTAIYLKYNSNDWFAEKIDAIRAYAGELVNETFYILVEKINEKSKRGEALTHDEIDIIKHFSEKHRTAQPFFVTRTETATADPNKVGRIIDTLNNNDDLAESIKLAHLAANPSLQDPGQTGQSSDVHAEPDPDTTPLRAPESPPEFNS